MDIKEASLEFKKWLDEANQIVFLTGAGISTSSNIPDIRGEEGLRLGQKYLDKYHANYETIMSHNYFFEKTNSFYDFYKNEIIRPDAKPNLAHYFLAEYNNKSTIITQNIDGLHQLAGAKNIIELHGSISKNRCVKCGKLWNLEKIISSDSLPKCNCGGLIKPDVVLFDEPLSFSLLTKANDAIYKSDLLVVIGSSLLVNPAASLVQGYRGRHLVIINKTPTPYDGFADLIINASIIDIINNIKKS